MNFLIISQTIYPSQFPRAFRATELAKELGKQGHQVTLYAVLGKFNYLEFEKNNPNVKVKNIGAMLFAKVNSDINDNVSDNVLFRAFKRIFGRLFDFPDIELAFRIPKIIYKESSIDCLITIALPFTIHWGAAFGKSFFPKDFPKTWIADCGDPYMGNEFRKPYFYFKYFEKWAFRKTNYITVPIETAKEGYYKEFHPKIKVIPQGFSFNNVAFQNIKSLNSVPTFAYSGILYKDFRDPSLFLQYLTTITANFKFIVYTKSRELILPFMEKLKNKLEVHDYIPREELLCVLSGMDFLINFENPSVKHSPSKLIDYALTKKPILSIKANEIPEKIFNEFLQGNYTNQLIVNDLERYNIINVAKQFISLIKER